ncbi:MAG: MazG nucleotide pyrophosphohydrolase domain-containing protein [Syntrophotalea acetylenica]|jgi:NTP pyrophosphatase (non-canonical NTP hydrolase)|uniref:Antitoxin n=1 Tax=Syntrophotalea acetylenica TaxID=29542 RepID=A0A1L3GKA5_SYNAC|nr:MazG nucleotide pyrophosphohydrolase domain-containing protein [Syntrophotalea acetylenica]APG26354.1 antitoxin [Syntrophotalea acetylenica]APG45329.1 antitoxin [Syntrophotalea acetylenica]MDD4456723.1 MazG nucleotide pyrophosphohydrolase domain-containing protein [Syntrophotalea acetylenica]MDY0262958.1 MazG nucleotide pyrophosphohydrolase domain-containing protein [Syntrophotalea acetylenica]
MDNKAYADIFDATLQKWGIEAQYDQAIEECAELIAALKHFKRGKVTESEIIDELADVILMTQQLVFMLGEDRVDSAITRKVEKLRLLLHAR